MSYPGKDKNIPGRIIEALEDLPLSYLVPKDGLAALVNAPMRVSLPFDKTIFTSADDGRDVNINVLGTANSTTSSIKNEAEKERLVFKRPSNFTSSANSVDYVPTNFLEGLSPLAQSVLSTHKGLNDSINIEKKSEIVSRPEAKHKLESVTSNAGNLSFNDNSSNKKTKTSTGVTMTQANLAEQYLNDLKNILDIVGFDQNSAEIGNIEYWLQLPNKKLVLTTNCLTKLQMTIKNITDNPQLSNSIEITWLLRLLDVMVCNIKFSKSSLKMGLDDSMLRYIALLSTIVLFNIFSLGKNDSNLHRESYIMEPVNFLSDLIESLKILTIEYGSLKIEFDTFQEALELLPKYIRNGP